MSPTPTPGAFIPLTTREAPKSRWYSLNRSKPFTFSVYFPLRSEGDRKVIGGDTLNSSFLQIARKGFNLLPERKFVSEKVKFKTLSPFLIRKWRKLLIGKERRDRFWVRVDHSEFEQRLRENMVRITGEEVKLLDLQVVGVVPVVCGSNNASA